MACAVALDCVSSATTRPPAGGDPADGKVKAEQEYSIGYEYMKQTNYDNAVAHFVAAINFWPRYYAAYIALGQAYRLKREFASAESTYHRAKAINPADTRAYDALGTLYFVDFKDYARALNEYRAALQLDSTDADLLNNMGAVCHRMKDYDQALGFYYRSLKLEPDNLTTSFAIAKIYVEKREPDKAVTYLEALKASRPEVTDIRKQLGEVYLQLKKYPEAAVEYTWLAARNPDNIYYRLQLGQTYLRQKKYPSAQKEFEAARKLAPEDPAPLLYLADLNITRSRLGDAEKNVQEAFKLSPDNAYAHILLGDICAQRGYGAKLAFDKKKSAKTSKANGIAAVNLLKQAQEHYGRGKADAQFASYAATEIERTGNWLKQLKDDLWFYHGVKL